MYYLQLKHALQWVLNHPISPPRLFHFKLAEFISSGLHWFETIGS